MMAEYNQRNETTIPFMLSSGGSISINRTNKNKQLVLYTLLLSSYCPLWSKLTLRISLTTLPSSVLSLFRSGFNKAVNQIRKEFNIPMKLVLVSTRHLLKTVLTSIETLSFPLGDSTTLIPSSPFISYHCTHGAVGSFLRIQLGHRRHHHYISNINA